MFLLRDKLITQGEKRETSIQNFQRNNVARQVEGFCISYFAALSSRTKTATAIMTSQICTFFPERPARALFVWINLLSLISNDVK